MRIIFLSNLYPDSLVNYCSTNSKVGLDWAAHNLSKALVDGFISNDIEVTLLNTPMVGSFPFLFRKIYVPSFASGQIESVSFVNFPFLKKQIINRHIKHLLLEKCHVNNSDTAILFYNFPNISLSKLIHKLFPKIKQLLLVTDLPEYMSTAKISHDWIKTLCPQGKICESDCFDYIDGFILLAPKMVEKLPINNKPWIQIEGIYNSTCNAKVVSRDRKKAILYTGNLGRRYGILTLLEAFSLISGSEYRLWIRGNGDCELQVKEAMSKDSRIVYFDTMTREELLTLEKRATLLVNPVPPSQTFTNFFFPSKTLEYLASGTPTLMYNLGCLPESYLNHIFTIETENAKYLSGRIIEICNMLQSELDAFGQEASNFIYKEKTPLNQCSKIISFMQRL